MEILLSIISVLLSLFCGFVGGWLIATDKNRNEIFKQKLESYRKLVAQISKVYTLGVAIEIIDDNEVDKNIKKTLYKKEASSLLLMTFSETIFLEQTTFNQLNKFLEIHHSEYLKRREEIKEILQTFREDLRLRELNTINMLTTSIINSRLIEAITKKIGRS
jgi:hypothetical protein